MVHRAGRSEPWRHTSWTYRWRALTHYAQTTVAIVPIAILALTLSFTAALAGLMGTELLVLLLLPHAAGFRRQVDGHLERIACLRAATARVALLARMSDEHRRELERLEDLTGRIGASRQDGGADDDEWLGMDNLLAAFVRIAIAHRESEAAFHLTSEAHVAREIARLEALRAEASAPRDSPGEADTWMARRLAILTDRGETHRRARAERALLASQLATIGQLVRWMHEQAAIGRSTGHHDAVIDAISSCARSGPALRGLARAPAGVDGRLLRIAHGPIGGGPELPATRSLDEEIEEFGRSVRSTA